VVAEGERKCESCAVRKATIHLTDFVDGQAVQRHLCEECYASFGEVPLAPTNVFAQLVAAIAPELKELSSHRCPHCGTSYLEFRQTMKLGCPRDYEVFEDPMEQLLERIHGSARHVGKVPPDRRRESSREETLRLLQDELQKAVKEENYERAAELRDRIAELEADEAD